MAAEATAVGGKRGCNYLKKNDITHLLCSSGVIVSISY
jgi:hypothetical protein